MSQIYKKETAGNMPPQVATSYQTDDGTAIPIANVLIVSAADTTDNNDNGIRTVGGGTDATAGNEVRAELTNRMTSQFSTNDDSATVTNIISLGVTPGTYVFWGKIIAYNTTDSLGGTWDIEGAVRTDGATATEIAVEVKNVNVEGDMVNCVVTAGVSTNFFTVTAEGLAAKDINWNLLMEYRFVS